MSKATSGVPGFSVKTPKEVVRQGYDLVSTAYRGDDPDVSSSQYRRYVSWVERISRRLGSGSRILDLGCGCGVPVSRLLAAQHRVRTPAVPAREREPVHRRPMPLRPRPGLRLLLPWALMCGTLASCGGRDVDTVTRLSYTQHAVDSQLLRRARLLSAGVPLRNELSVYTTWTNVLGYRFIARRPDGPELGISATQVIRDGIRLGQSSHHVVRVGLGRYRLRGGAWIVHVFSPTDRHTGSVAADSTLSGRRILEHLGVWRRVSDRISRSHMDLDELARWRNMLPTLLRNGGYASIVLRATDSGRNREPNAAAAAPSAPRGARALSDSLEGYVDRYQVEELDEYTLVGKRRAGEGYRHVFTIGSRYVMTGIWIWPEPVSGDSLLLALGLAEGGLETPPVRGPAAAPE
jgi:hypothetical protein